MANTNKKYASINDQTAQQMRNNQNTVEILTKIDQALNSNESFVTITTVDSSGSQTNSQIPTLGYFKQKLDQLTKMVHILSGVDGNPAALQIANNQFKRIVVADLNIEPKPVPALSPVSTFTSNPNWIFDTFLNPLISITVDLTGKIDDDTKTVDTKRFIVQFEEIITIDVNGNNTTTLSSNGATRLTEFNTKYKGKSNIDIVEFVTWLDTPGVVNRVDDNLIDQGYRRVEPNRLQYKGDFTITGTDIDTLNKKLWYILDTLTYYDISDVLNPPKPISLKLGDYVNVNPNVKDVHSTTVYTVVEISTITSEYRVRFEQVYGEEPIPVRLNALSIYSENVPSRTVKVPVGFDEYNVLFVRQVDDMNNLIGLDWSPGVGFLTNELRLDNANGQLFSDYYISTVEDYGAAIADLVAKKVPNAYGIKPNAPVLDITNFKVVQTNAHLTQTVDAEQIRDLHNNKNNLTSQISSIQGAIDKQNRLIATTSFDSNADRKRANDELTLLSNKLNTANTTKATVVKNILANQQNINQLKPTYSVRGFFPMPDATTSTKTQPQEVVQFEIWYRKLSKSGDQNPILTITDLNNSSARTSSPLNTTATVNISKPKTINGAFSNWNKYKSDARKRAQDPTTGKWYWEIVDVSNADTPNINQVDIPVSPGEQVEIKIISLSEVGWPEAPIESDFSNVVAIPFPNDLNSVLNSDQFILQAATADDTQITLQQSLDSQGLTLHLNSAIRSQDIYYAHTANSIASGFQDNQGKIIDLYTQLLSMVNSINTLQQTINQAKGILEVYLVNNSNNTRLFNGNNLTFNINLEDYMTKTKIGLISNPVDSTARTYRNDIISINTFSLLIKNTATVADLGLLSYRGYGQANGLTPSPFAYDGGSVALDGITLTPVVNGTGTGTGSGAAVQATWVSGDSTVLGSTITTNSLVSAITAPYFGTQQNNQWLWLEVRDINGNYIYNGDTTQPANKLWNSTALNNRASVIINTLHSKTFNQGFLSYNNPYTSIQSVLPTTPSPITKMLDPLNWSVAENPASPLATGTIPGNTGLAGSMASTIHPVIGGFSDITDTSNQLIKFIKTGDTNSILIPIYIYVKPFTGSIVYKPGIASPYNTAFIDTSDNNNTLTPGDMPGIATGSITKTGANLLQIDGVNISTHGIIKLGDRIIVSGISTPGATGANGIILTVTGLSAVTGTVSIITDYNIATVGSSSPYSETFIQIVQLHKAFRRSSALTTTTTSTSTLTGLAVGNELISYVVLGQIISDQRYVTEYIEIKSTTAVPSPILHTKKLRFYMEDQNNIRPFEFQLNWNLTQYKPIKVSNQNTGNLVVTG